MEIPLYQTLKPSPELADVVDHLWISKGCRPLHDFERALPSGMVEIVINPADGELRCYDEWRDGLRRGKFLQYNTSILTHAAKSQQPVTLSRACVIT